MFGELSVTTFTNEGSFGRLVLVGATRPRRILNVIKSHLLSARSLDLLGERELTADEVICRFRFGLGGVSSRERENIAAISYVKVKDIPELKCYTYL